MRAATANLTPAAAVNAPSLPNLKKTVQRQKHQQDPLGRIQPVRLEELELPDHVVQLLNGDNFLLFDSGQATENNRHVLNTLSFSVKQSLTEGNCM